jgi:ATP-dependent RNA helicase DHX8/PRP22
LLHAQVHVDEGPGDVLVFLTSQDEIESLERLIKV